MSLEKNVKKMLTWKKSAQFIADKLNISVEQVKEIKSKIKKEITEAQSVIESKVDLENNTTELRALTATEPKSPEQIEKLLKINTKEWKLSSYWIKQVKEFWSVSAQVVKKTVSKDEQLIKDLIQFNPVYTPLKKDQIFVNNVTEPQCAVISMQDLHFGKEGNEDIATRYQTALKRLLYSSSLVHRLDKIIFVVGGDLLNVDTFNNTTTSGTSVDCSKDPISSYKEAFDSMYWSINVLKQFCETLEVVYVPGNHDRLSSFHITHALEKSIQDPNIIWNVEYSERKVVNYGVNMFCFEHGDVKVDPLVYATEFPKQWGDTSHRVIFTGHFHTKKTGTFITENEINGIAVKILPSLSNTDYWHYHNKYTCSKKAGVMEIYSNIEGKVAEYNITF